MFKKLGCVYGYNVDKSVQVNDVAKWERFYYQYSVLLLEKAIAFCMRLSQQYDINLYIATCI